MNSLIAVGAVTSFTAGALSALLPGFSVDPSFLEEPVMLLAFVLLGRSLEARARLSASGEPAPAPCAVLCQRGQRGRGRGRGVSWLGGG